jgi:tRNA modification GTPase
MKPIVALATPPINSAIHIIRMSGDNVFDIINKICEPQILKEGYKIQYTNIVIDGQKIDSAIINKFVMPHSFTGEDMIEINCHGGYYLSQKIIHTLLKYGCDMAKNGEFTMRSVLNNKNNLIQAEAINNLITANNDYSLISANIGLAKKTSYKLIKFKKVLFDSIATLEINIDYPEDDVLNSNFKHELLSNIDFLMNEFKETINISKQVTTISNGINIAIIGDTNVGKSSLLNALLNQEKAIVTNIPGTTRDIVQANVNINGLTFILNDSAGIRNSKNKIEKAGIDKTYELIKKADLVLHVFDGSKKITEKHEQIQKLIKDKKYINVINKCDLKHVCKINGVKISSIKKQITPLINEIVKLFPKINLLDKELILQSNYSINLLERSFEKLLTVRQQIKDNQPIDLILDDLHSVLDNVLEMLGEKKDFDFLNEMFKDFCIGK